MSRVDRSAAAKRDFQELWFYIAADDPQAADRLLLRLEERAQFLAGSPLVGTSRPLLGRELRSFVVGNYLIIYRPIANGIRLVRVLNAARDLRWALRR